MSLVPEIVVATTSAEGSAAATWELDTGTQLASFKQCSAAVNGLAVLGTDYFIAAQQQKDAIHVYSWFKEAIHQRSFSAEKLTAITTAPSGGFIAAGSSSGMLYLWATSSGRLMVAHKAHFQAITCLRFTDHQGHFIFSGGKDSILSCWEVMQLLDASAMANSVQPRWSKAVHTLPITGLAVGADACTPCVVSSSLDRTCRVWNGASGHLANTLRLAHAAHCVALSWLENTVFVGLSDGTIVHASINASEAQQHAAEEAAVEEAAKREQPAEPAQAGECMALMRGHTSAVTCVSQSGDGEHLVSGSMDGSTRVWDIPSHQCIRTLRKPCASPVTNVLVLPRPHHLHVSGAARSTDAGGQPRETRKQLKPKRLAPLAALCKFAGPSDALRPWEDGVAIIHGAHDVAMHGLHACGYAGAGIAEESGLAAACRAIRGDVAEGGRPGAGAPAARVATGGTPVQALEAEAETLRAEAAAWKRKYAELYEASFEAIGQLSQVAK